MSPTTAATRPRRLVDKTAVIFGAAGEVGGVATGGAEAEVGRAHYLQTDASAEATNTWWSNYGQLRRNTDRRARHRHAELCLATTILNRRPAHRLTQPLEPHLTAYPLKSLPTPHIPRRPGQRQFGTMATPSLG
jgi:hypothetical protein